MSEKRLSSEMGFGWTNGKEVSMDGVLQLGAMGKACHNDGDPLGLDMGPFTRFADDIYGFFVFLW